MESGSRLIVTGANGQLGRELLDVLRDRPGTVTLPLVRAHSPGDPPGAVAVDLADLDALSSAVERARPDAIIHAGAMTNVDLCEKTPADAHRVNAEATGTIAEAAARVGARMVYVSTDYVFDGTAGPYDEDSPVNPVQEYGRSKLAGERLASEALDDLVIARTSVVYGPWKKNFVTWLIGELKAGRPVRIVDDQFVSPTLAADLASQVLALLDSGERGIFNTAGASQVSRLEMARLVADTFRLDPSFITAIKSSDLTWLAKRPANCTLDVSKVSKHRKPLGLAEALRVLKGQLEAHTSQA